MVFLHGDFQAPATLLLSFWLPRLFIIWFLDAVMEAEEFRRGLIW
jgi:hypothetical protein